MTRACFARPLFQSKKGGEPDDCKSPNHPRRLRSSRLRSLLRRHLASVQLIQDFLLAEGARTFCEFKGAARYWTVDVNGRRSENAAWSYPAPSERFRPIKDCLAFYASRVDACFVGEEKVKAQAGDFYGGWVTSRVVGPFKGGPGSMGW